MSLLAHLTTQPSLNLLRVAEVFFCPRRVPFRATGTARPTSTHRRTRP